jgi:hypothetical protein
MGDTYVLSTTSEPAMAVDCEYDSTPAKDRDRDKVGALIRRLSSTSTSVIAFRC